MQNEVIKQLKILLKEKDYQSIKYILGDQTKEYIKQISQYFNEEQINKLYQLYDQIKNQKIQLQQEPLQTKQARNNKIDNYLNQKGQNLEVCHQNFLDMLTKANQKLIYQEQYGYPYYDLFKRILSTHGDSNPNMQTIKALHSQIQIFYLTIFNQKAIKTINQNHSNFIQGLKTYLNIIFPNHLQKFYKFNSVYKNIKKETNDQFSDSPDEQEVKEINLSLDETLELDEKQFIVAYSQSINPEQFQQFQRNRSYNMLCFSTKHFKTFLSLSPSFYVNLKKEKQFIDLISFLSMRFSRKIIFTIIKQRGNGTLQQIKQPITPQQIKTVGNEQIDSIQSKIKEFVIPKKTIQVLAKEAFIDEFHDYSYKDFIPSKWLNQKLLRDMSLEEYIWNKSRQYRNLWSQRMKAQRYIRQGGDRPQCDYVQFLENHKELFKSDSKATWKKFIMNKFGFQENKVNPLQKKMKLQSLKD